MSEEHNQHAAASEVSHLFSKLCARTDQYQSVNKPTEAPPISRSSVTRQRKPRGSAENAYSQEATVYTPPHRRNRGQQKKEWFAGKPENQSSPRSSFKNSPSTSSSERSYPDAKQQKSSRKTSRESSSSSTGVVDKKSDNALDTVIVENVAQVKSKRREPRKSKTSRVPQNGIENTAPKLVNFTQADTNLPSPLPRVADSDSKSANKSSLPVKQQFTDVSPNVVERDVPEQADAASESIKVEQKTKNSETGSKRRANKNNKRLKETSNSQVPELTTTPEHVLDESKPSREVLAELEKEELFPLKKKSLRFPKARYYCRLCEYHCDTVSISRKHISEQRHQRLMKLRKEERFLRDLPVPCQAHLVALTQFLEQIAREHGLSTEEYKHREDIVTRLNRIMAADVPGGICRLYGSTFSGFGLKSSDVNIDLVHSCDKNVPEFLIKTANCLQEHKDQFHDLERKFSLKVPAVAFTDKTTMLPCSITASTELSWKTCNLLRTYCMLDSRCRTLGIAFRYWAKLCGIDKQHRGTLPPHAFTLMVIYFLQQVQPPVLPVLHELRAESHNANKERKLANKDRQRNESESEAEADQSVADSTVDDDDEALDESLEMDVTSGANDNDLVEEDDSTLWNEELLQSWKSKNTMSSGELWVKMLKFYAVEYTITEYVICIRHLQHIRLEDKKWSQKRLSIEDPSYRKRKLSRTISSQKVHEYIVDRFRSAYKYFAVPQTRTGPLFTRIESEVQRDSLSTDLRKDLHKMQSSAQENCLLCRVLGKTNPIAKNIKVASSLNRNISLKTDNGSVVKSSETRLKKAEDNGISLQKGSAALPLPRTSTRLSDSIERNPDLSLDDQAIIAVSDVCGSAKLEAGSPVKHISDQSQSRSFSFDSFLCQVQDSRRNFLTNPSSKEHIDFFSDNVWYGHYGSEYTDGTQSTSSNTACEKHESVGKDVHSSYSLDHAFTTKLLDLDSNVEKQQTCTAASPCLSDDFEADKKLSEQHVLLSDKDNIVCALDKFYSTSPNFNESSCKQANTLDTQFGITDYKQEMPETVELPDVGLDETSNDFHSVSAPATLNEFDAAAKMDSYERNMSEEAPELVASGTPVTFFGGEDVDVLHSSFVDNSVVEEGKINELYECQSASSSSRIPDFDLSLLVDSTVDTDQADDVELDSVDDNTNAQPLVLEDATDLTSSVKMNKSEVVDSSGTDIPPFPVELFDDFYKENEETKSDGLDSELVDNSREQTVQDRPTKSNNHIVKVPTGSEAVVLMSKEMTWTKKTSSIQYTSKRNFLSDLRQEQLFGTTLMFASVPQHDGTTLHVPSHLARYMLQWLSSFTCFIDHSTLSVYFDRFRRRLKREHKSEVARLLTICLLIIRIEPRTRWNNPQEKLIRRSFVAESTSQGHNVVKLMDYLCYWKFYFDSDMSMNISPLDVETVLSFRKRTFGVFQYDDVHDQFVLTVTPLSEPIANSISLPRIGFQTPEALQDKLEMDKHFQHSSYFAEVQKEEFDETYHIPIELAMHLLEFVARLTPVDRVKLSSYFHKGDGRVWMCKKINLLELAKYVSLAVLVLREELQNPGDDALPLLNSFVCLVREFSYFEVCTVRDFATLIRPFEVGINKYEVDSLVSVRKLQKSDSGKSTFKGLVTIMDIATRGDKSEKVVAPVKASRNRVDRIYRKELVDNLTVTDLTFVFDADILTDGQEPDIVCAMCQKLGHLKQDCPDDVLPELEPLPPLPQSYRKDLTAVCYDIYEYYRPSSSEVKERIKSLQELESYIRKANKDAKLTLFGSSVNGFGFLHSDMDICMTLGDDTGEKLNYAEIIEDLAKHLKGNKSLYNITAISTAKVPIVKFKFRKSNLEGDISLYNLLAQHNTRMLRLYSNLDIRVKVLGYVVKAFAKACDMGDASRGSLSSYAYILLVIYYLQQCQPPVIPVLQELYEGKMPEVIVDGWNAWFFDDTNQLREKWPYWDANVLSVGDLWLGMLRFYTERFNFKENVVSIRQLKPLTRFEKLWNNKTIAIEDPFDLNHNLGAGLSRKMSSYILKAFIKARQHFGTPTPIRNVIALYNYLFDPWKLTDGEPPNDRGCRLCGKIGHFVKECPNTVRARRKEAAERSQLIAERETKDRELKNPSSEQQNVTSPTNRNVSVPVMIPQMGSQGRTGPQSPTSSIPLLPDPLVTYPRLEVMNREQTTRYYRQTPPHASMSNQVFYNQSWQQQQVTQGSPWYSIEQPSSKMQYPQYNLFHSREQPNFPVSLQSPHAANVHPRQNAFINAGSSVAIHSSANQAASFQNALTAGDNTRHATALPHSGSLPLLRDPPVPSRVNVDFSAGSVAQDLTSSQFRSQSMPPQFLNPPVQKLWYTNIQSQEAVSQKQSQSKPSTPEVKSMTPPQFLAGTSPWQHSPSTQQFSSNFQTFDNTSPHLLWPSQMPGHQQ